MSTRKGTGYEIKAYEEKFIEDQARIGMQATKDWTMYRQTPAEELRKVYSASAFDFGTRFYAVSGGGLVGFLTASITSGPGEKTAVMRPPLVEKGHQKAERMLMDRAVKVLREKGVSVVSADVGNGWGSWPVLMRDYGFADAGVSSYLAEKSISELDPSKLPAPDGVEMYDSGKDREAFLAMLAGFGMPPDRARMLVDQYESGAKSSYFRRVVVFRTGSKAVAASAITVSESEPHVGRAMRVMSVPGIDLREVRGKVVRKLLETSKKDGFKRFRMMLMPDAVHDYDDVFAALGMTAIPFLHTYRKRL